MAPHELPIDRALGVVLGALGGGELDRDPLGIVLGQVVARELDDVFPVHHRSDEVPELRFAPVGSLRRGRQPQTKGGEARTGREGVRRAGQVVALVEDDEAKARAEVLHVKERGIVRRYGDRLHVVFPAPDEANRAAEGGAEQVEPLTDQIEGRRDDEGAPPLVVYGEDRDVALAGTRRQDDDAATAVRAPRRERFGLVGARVSVHPGPVRELRVAPRRVVVRGLRRDERAHDIGIGSGRGAVAARSIVPGAGRRRRDSLGPAAHFEGAGHERDGDHGPIASTVAARRRVDFATTERSARPTWGK